MGVFDMPRGELELKLKDSKGTHWDSVMLTDYLDMGMVMGCVEEWSVNHKVLSARYNGNVIAFPKKYHWELIADTESLPFETRAEAEAVMSERRKLRTRLKDKTIKVGSVFLVYDYD